ncbi:hypothetical protein [Carboxylicivirga marina]|uniref:Uncharacterized protein n=1 Tax=Carboxylicivirga marina TaxID=2800988 RepID=A0ABS1HHA8_9BACT|nr:hypothetical protein [Carboxylicivirga marina]MBK3517010.1 hypothetical protein [Carboxylicivirga marina]
MLQSNADCCSDIKLSFSFVVMGSQILNNQKKAFSIFKQWSRKGYAIFGSLGNVVHIGCLSVALLQCIGLLLGHIETMLSWALQPFNDDCMEENRLAEPVLLTLKASTDIVSDVYNRLR